MRVLVIVPARGGSKGLPGKNVREVGGISLVGRAVRAAQAALRDLAGEARILLDTDSEEIAAEGRRHEAWVPFLRPATLAADDTPSMDNLLFALDRVAAAGGSPEWVVVL